jgi:hypothetical protein
MTDQDKDRLYFFVDFKMVPGSENRKTLTMGGDIHYRMVGDPGDRMADQNTPTNAQGYTTPRITHASENSLEVRYRPDVSTFKQSVAFDQDGAPTIDRAVMRAACQDRLTELLCYLDGVKELMGAS